MVTRQFTAPSTMEGGDLIIAMVGAAGDPDPGAATSTGFTQQTTGVGTHQFDARLTVLYKFADGVVGQTSTEAGATFTVNVNPNSTERSSLGYMIVRGIDQTMPFSASSVIKRNASSNINIDWDPVAVTYSNSLVLACVATKSEEGTIPVPTGYSTEFNLTSVSRGVAAFSKLVSSAGSEDPGTIAGPDDEYSVVTLALKPVGNSAAVTDPITPGDVKVLLLPSQAAADRHFGQAQGNGLTRNQHPTSDQWTYPTTNLWRMSPGIQLTVID